MRLLGVRTGRSFLVNLAPGLVLGASVLAGCNCGPAPLPGCASGAFRSCAGPAGCFGTQACGADGGWGACSCPGSRGDGGATDGGGGDADAGTDDGGSRDAGPSSCSPDFAGHNDSTVLGGATLGTGTSSTSVLRKAVPLQLLGADAGFGAPSIAYLLRDTSTTEAAYLAIPVTNMDAQPYCFVQVPLLWIAADGGQLASTHTFVYGSTGVIRSISTLTNSCLGPGELGYAYDIQVPALDGGIPYFDATAALQLSPSASSAGTAQIGNPAAAMVPLSYSANSPTAFTAPFSNTGCDAGSVDGLSRWILLDNTGLPLIWGFADSVTPSPVPPQSTGALSATVFYEGSGSQLYVALDISGSSTCCHAAQPLTDREALQALDAHTLELLTRARP